jgi:hypothetical protein
MLGRGALADPWLARAAAAELGLACAPPVRVAWTPTEWLPLVRRHVELSVRMGVSDLRTVARAKQWLRMANDDERMPWFEALKQCQGTQDFLAGLADLAALEPGRRSA